MRESRESNGNKGDIGDRGSDIEGNMMMNRNGREGRGEEREGRAVRGDDGADRGESGDTGQRSDRLTGAGRLDRILAGNRGEHKGIGGAGRILLERNRNPSGIRESLDRSYGSGGEGRKGSSWERDAEDERRVMREKEGRYEEVNGNRGGDRSRGSERGRGDDNECYQIAQYDGNRERNNTNNGAITKLRNSFEMKMNIKTQYLGNNLKYANQTNDNEANEHSNQCRKYLNIQNSFHDEKTTNLLLEQENKISNLQNQVEELKVLVLSLAKEKKSGHDKFEGEILNHENSALYSKLSNSRDFRGYECRTKNGEKDDISKIRKCHNNDENTNNQSDTSGFGGVNQDNNKMIRDHNNIDTNEKNHIRYENTKINNKVTDKNLTFTNRIDNVGTYSDDVRKYARTTTTSMFLSTVNDSREGRLNISYHGTVNRSYDKHENNSENGRKSNNKNNHESENSNEYLDRGPMIPDSNSVELDDSYDKNQSDRKPYVDRNELRNSTQGNFSHLNHSSKNRENETIDKNRFQNEFPTKNLSSKNHFDLEFNNQKYENENYDESEYVMESLSESVILQNTEYVPEPSNNSTLR